MPLRRHQTTRLVKDNARRTELIRYKPVDVCSGRSCVRAPGFQLLYAAVAINTSVGQNLDLVGGNRRETDLLPHLVISSNKAVWHRDPNAAIPVLHFKPRQPINAERHGLSRLSRVGIVILTGENIDLVDGLAAIEGYLQPVWKTITGCSIIPAPAAPPIQALPLTIIC